VQGLHCHPLYSFTKMVLLFSGSVNSIIVLFSSLQRMIPIGFYSSSLTVRVDVHLHLSYILMGQFADLQIKQQKAFKQTIIKKQDLQKTVALESKPVRSPIKQETFT